MQGAPTPCPPPPGSPRPRARLRLAPLPCPSPSPGSRWGGHPLWCGQTSTDPCPRRGVTRAVSLPPHPALCLSPPTPLTFYCLRSLHCDVCENEFCFRATSDVPTPPHAAAPGTRHVRGRQRGRSGARVPLLQGDTERGPMAGCMGWAPSRLASRGARRLPHAVRPRAPVLGRSLCGETPPPQVSSSASCSSDAKVRVQRT